MDASAPEPAPVESLDPMTSDPRAIMRALLPAARAEYVKAWEWLADPATSLDRRRAGRERAKAIAADHGIVAAALRERERTLTGDDLLNVRHLADELERHVAALERIVTVSPLGLQGTKDLRPEALGCGRRYRDPSRAQERSAGTRGASSTPKGRPRDARGRDGRDDRPDRPRDPKPPRDMLGSSKHDSPLANTMDEATRAKLEAMRQDLQSGD